MNAIAHPAYVNSEYMARGELHRAIVEVPERFSKDRDFCERIVFFDCKSTYVPGPQLADLLAAAWNMDTSDWRARGLIYNVESAHELRLHGLSDELWMRIYETGSRGDEILYCTPDEVDLFVAPRMRRSMLEAMAALPRPIKRAETIHA